MNLSNTAAHHLGAQLKSRSSALVSIENSIYACLILITLSGNVLVLLTLYRTPRSVTNLLISSLAISDILMPVLCCFQSLCVLVVGHWPFGEFICQLQAFGVIALACASLQIMGLAAVNRYFCIVRPFDYRRIFTARRTKLMIAAVWVLASTEPLPYLISGKRYVFHPGKFFCFQGKEVSFQSLLIYGYVGLSMGTIILCYFNVFLTLSKHQRTVANRLRHMEISSQATSVEEINATNTFFSYRYWVCGCLDANPCCGCNRFRKWRLDFTEAGLRHVYLLGCTFLGYKSIYLWSNEQKVSSRA